MISVRLNPVRMEDGAIRVFGVADDVTERAAAERQRMEEVVKQRDILVREVHHRIKNNLQGVAGLIQQAATARPEVAPALEEAAAQIQAIAQVHGLQIRATGTLPVLGVAQGIFQNLASMFGAEIRFEPPPPDLWRFGLPENEAVPLALVINELGTNAIKHRQPHATAIRVHVASRPEGMEFVIENPGPTAAGVQPGGHRRERVGTRPGEGPAAASRRAPVDRSLRRAPCWHGCNCSRRPFARRMSESPRRQRHRRGR